MVDQHEHPHPTVRRYTRAPRHFFAVILLLTCVLPTLAWSQTTPATQALLSVPPKQWAKDAAENEKKVIRIGGVFLRYRARIVRPSGVELRDVMESKDGTVARMIEKDGRPLTPEEDQWERGRLQAMIDSPAAFAKHVKGDVSGKKTGEELVSLMPESMIFTYVPGQPQIPRPGEHAPEVVIDFQPDPKWTPPTMTSEALTGFEGRLWIDSETHTLVRIDGKIFRPINFGYGMLARIFPGGEVSLEQVNVGNDHWIYSHLVEHLTMRALMVKTIKENREITSTDFKIVPELRYQDAIHVLLDTPLPK